MTKLWVIKRSLLLVGACLGLAWVGATQAAGRERDAALETPPAGAELSLIKSDAESIVVELTVSSFEVQESSSVEGVYHSVTASGCGDTDDVGRPRLPVRGTLLGIPAEAEYSLRVLETEEEAVPGRYNILAVPQAVMETDEEGNPVQMSYHPVRDEAVYSSDSFYPASIAELGSDGFIRDQRVLQLRFFPFRYNAISGELRHASRIRVEIRFSYPDGPPRLAATPSLDDSFGEVFQSALLNYDSARQWRAKPSAATLSEGPVLGQGDPSYKVLVDEDGIYQLTYTDLVSAGLELTGAQTGDFELYNQGQEVAILVADEDDDGQFDEEDYILFYGQQMTTTYTYTNVYWLEMGAGDGLRMPEKDGTLGASTVLTYFSTTARVEENSEYYGYLPVPTAIPSEEELDHWFAGFVREPVYPVDIEQDIALDGLAGASPPYSATLRGRLSGRDIGSAEYDHRARIYLNGQMVHEPVWSGEGEHLFQTSISDSLLAEGDNTILVECVAPDPLVADYGLIYVDWFEIDYRRTYTAENNALFFDGDGAGTWQYEVPGFLTSTIEVFDATDPLSVTHFLSTTVEHSGTYTLKYQDSITEERHYLALTPEQYRTPVIQEDDPSNLRSTSNAADYIVIAPSGFHDAVQPLADHRETEGLDVEVVDVQDVYDEFNHGIFNPRAIRDFLEYAYANWTPPAPSYVLLVGDGHFDFKDYKGYGEPNYVPPYLIYADPWFGETASDNRYVCVSGGDQLPDMYIGRLPARTADQVTTMVSKTVDYETSLPEGDWRKQVLFLADDPDDPEDPNSPNHFWSLSDDVADRHLPPEPLYEAEKVYCFIPPYMSIEAIKTAVTSSFETGRLFINYVGHAGPVYWAGYPPGFFLKSSEVAALPESDKTPVVLAMACMEGYFIFPNSPESDSLSCVAESLIRAQGKGSVANWSPTSEGLSSRQHYLHVGFYDGVFRDSVHQLGPATALGKLNLFQNTTVGQRELIDTYMVFGDPALEMPIERTYMGFLPLGLKGH